MADYPYFPFYVEDFAMGTAGMSPAAVGIYIRCLCHQWSHGFVPADVRTVARLAGALPDEVEEAWPAIVVKFNETAPGRLQNARLEAERAKVLNTSKVRSGAGKAGAAARWKNGKGIADALPQPIAKALANGVPKAKPTALAEPLTNAMPTQWQADNKSNGKAMTRAFDSDSDSSLGSLSSVLETSSPPTPPASIDRTWGWVGEELRKLGISRVSEALSAAQDRQLTIDDACDLINQWRTNSGAWGAGALFDRLVGRAAAWPPAAPEFERQRQRDKSVAAHEANVANRKAGEARRQADRERYAALNEKHASDVDAWDGSRILAALEGDPTLVGMYQRSGLCRLVRERLYEILEQPVTA